MPHTGEPTSSAPPSSTQDIDTLTNRFSEIIDEGISNACRNINEENATAFSAQQSTLQDIKPKWPVISNLSRTPTFSGNGDDANQFLERFQLFAKFNRWNNDEMIRAFPLSLTNNAEVWYSTLDKSLFTTFDQLIQLFRDRLLSSTSHWVLCSELSQRKQGVQESICDYSTDIRRRYQRLGIPLSEQLHFFIQGLKPSLRNHVILQQPKTLDQAENAARIKESLNEPPTNALTAKDVLTLQQQFVSELKAQQLLAQPSVHAIDHQSQRPQHNVRDHSHNNDDSIRRIIREELRSLPNSSPRRNNDDSRPYFNNRGDFGRANRTTTGHVICYNCKRVGHHARNCRLPRAHQDDARIPAARNYNSREGQVRSSARSPHYNSPPLN